MEDVLVLDIATLSLIASVFLPLLVGVVTKQVAHPGLKATILALLAAANGIVSSMIQDAGILTKETLVAAFISWVVAVSSYYGFLKPTTIAPKAAEATAEIGVG